MTDFGGGGGIAKLLSFDTVLQHNAKVSFCAGLNC